MLYLQNSTLNSPWILAHQKMSYQLSLCLRLSKKMEFEYIYHRRCKQWWYSRQTRSLRHCKYMLLFLLYLLCHLGSQVLLSRLYLRLELLCLRLELLCLRLEFRHQVAQQVALFVCLSYRANQVQSLCLLRK